MKISQNQYSTRTVGAGGILVGVGILEGRYLPTLGPKHQAAVVYE